jgi:hypothetical protein
MEHQHTILNEFARLEGRGDFGGLVWCAGGCGDVMNTVYRCRDCFDMRLYCASCMVHMHCRQPLHRIQVCLFVLCYRIFQQMCQVWDPLTMFFHKTSLKDIGLRIQLGQHPPGEACSGRQTTNDFTIVNLTGIHVVTLDFCACYGAPERHVQLLRIRLYPATFDNPSTAFSFQILRNFLSLSFNTRLSQLHFMDFLWQKMDLTGLRDTPVRLSVFNMPSL